MEINALSFSSALNVFQIQLYTPIISIKSKCNKKLSKCRIFTSQLLILMGEGFILLTRAYVFMGGVYHPPFDTLKVGTSTDDIKLKLYR